MRQRPAILALWALFILVPIALLSMVALNAITGKMATFEAAALNAKISKLRYSPIVEESFTNELGTLVESNPLGVSLTPLEKEKLVEQLTLFVHAYSDGKYESYREFRTPKGVDFSWVNRKTPGSIDDWLRGFHLPNALLNQSMEKKHKAFLVALNGDGTVYKQYFSAVCLEESKVIINRIAHTDLSSWLSDSYLETFKTAAKLKGWHFPANAYYSQKANLSYIRFTDDALDAVSQEYQTIAVADCFFYIQRRRPYPILTVVLRLYWNPKVSKWLPDDLVVCNMDQERVSPSEGYSIPIF